MLPSKQNRMASRNPNRNSKQTKLKTPDRFTPRPVVGQPEVVEPMWLLKALAVTLAVAMLFAYLAVCLLIWQGSWQLMLHPEARIDVTPSVPFQPIRFDAAATGTPRLSGWWIPAASPSAETPTILYLHGGSGSLSSSVRTLNLLHQASVHIFAIDYRGFGQSSPPHPTEERMAEDSMAALDYLVDTRHIPASTIVPYGEGLGAVLAANLARSRPELRSVILDDPDPNAFTNATQSGKAFLMPMRLLVQEHFDLAAALNSLHQPKLLLTDSPFGWETGRLNANQAIFRAAPDPKLVVSFDHPGEASEQAYVESIRRFLDEYLGPATSAPPQPETVSSPKE